jgi:peptidoglycan/xylan/chitin deacetylase (PgdA/CDA1 family)
LILYPGDTWLKMQDRPKHHAWPSLQASLEKIPKPRQWPAPVEKGLDLFKRRQTEISPGIHIFAYHTVVDETNGEEWEMLYKKGWVSKRNFEEHIEFLVRHMTPIPLSEVPQAFKTGELDRPFFVITFDDGYTDILNNAAPIINRHGIRPTVFVNGAFSGGRVFYRILAAMLVAKGHAGALARELKKRMPTVEWTENPKELFNQTKTHYRPYLVEEATESAYNARLGDMESLQVHLRPEDLKQLTAEGWEIGNHTFDHVVLSTLDIDQIDKTISSNRAYLIENGISPLDWLAYPVGRSGDVSKNVKNWLEKNDKINGIFCNGGVNLKRSRTQWLRLFAGNGGARVIRKNIEAETLRTRKALELAQSVR